MIALTNFYALLVALVFTRSLDAMEGARKPVIPIPRQLMSIEASFPAPAVSVEAKWLNDQINTIAVKSSHNLINGLEKHHHLIVNIGSEFIQKKADSCVAEAPGKLNPARTLMASLTSRGKLKVSAFVTSLARNVRFFEWSPTDNHLAFITHQGASTIIHFSERSEDVLSMPLPVTQKGCISCSWDYTGTILALLYKNKNCRLIFYDILKKSFIASLPVSPHTSSCAFNPYNHTILLGESIHKARDHRTRASLYITDVSDFLVKARSVRKILNGAAKL